MGWGLVSSLSKPWVIQIGGHGSRKVLLLHGVGIALELTLWDAIHIELRDARDFLLNLSICKIL